MAVAAGTRLGPYEVLSPLGAGGMGEVFKARDTRLGRSVAIKVLPSEFAENAQLRTRFEREARTISQLNHPNICAVYDVGENYLVMELLEGETLADRIARGALPIEQVLRYGSQIAEALDRAHKAGIVHRDLKPGNVMITKGGAKLLDFGLAKSAEPAFTLNSSVTQQKPLTQEGTIVGTLQYMAPEQLEGGDADERTDIFALGQVLYEMATGTRAFEGKNRTSLIAAIVSSQPRPIASLRPLTPAAFEAAVARCLEKDPNERWQCASDLRWELARIERDSDRAASQTRSRSSKAAWTAAAIFAAAAAAATALYVQSVRRARDQSPVRTSIEPPPNVVFDFYIEKGSAEISPDGSRIAFVGTSSGGHSLWVRALNSTTARELSGTDGATQLFWSPDSRTIGFYAGGFVKRIDANGGAPVTICESVVPIRGGSWSKDGVIIFGRPGGNGIEKVAAAGGPPADATILNEAKRDSSHRWPQFLPDGKHFIYFAGPHASDETLDTISVGSIDDPKMSKDVMRASSNAAYYDGWLLFVRDGLLVAQRFDTAKLDVVGEAITLEETAIEFDPAVSRSFFSISKNGTLIYETGKGLRETQFTWFDRSGKRLGTAGDPARIGSMALSPDGRSVAYSVLPRLNIWTMDLARGVPNRMTFAKANEYAPVWSPDGTKVAYASNRDARNFNIYVVDVATQKDEPLLVGSTDKTPSSWSPDGRYLLFTERIPGSANDIKYYDFVEKKSATYLATTFSEAGAHFSPDGKWVAYQSTAAQLWNVFIAPFPPTGARWQVSSRGGVQPRWRGDGKELFFYADRKVYAVPLKLTFPPAIGQTVPLFDAVFSTFQAGDPSPDGQKFLLNATGADSAPPAPLTLVQHFDTELRLAAERHDQ